jgi:hypothetical protein
VTTTTTNTRKRDTLSTSFTKYRPAIERLPEGTAQHPTLVHAELRRRRLYYTPFEHRNLDARLVVVGITPGPKQLRAAYQTVREMVGRPDAAVLNAAKRQGAFGGKAVRPNLVRMLNHFKVARQLGLANASDLWESGWDDFHATSVVPHAAFVIKTSGSEKPFAGSFDEVRSNDVLNECFEQDFLPTVRAMNRNAIWVGLGPTPKEALDWCVTEGLLRTDQVVTLAHPSSNSGSQVKYFLREVDRAALKPGNPVLARCDWLDAAYTKTREYFAVSSGGRADHTGCPAQGPTGGP